MGCVFIERKGNISRGYLHRAQKHFSKGVGMEKFFLFWSVVGSDLPFLSLQERDEVSLMRSCS
jgi:hypothetical protein